MSVKLNVSNVDFNKRDGTKISLNTIVDKSATEAIKEIETKGQEVLQSIPQDFTTQMASKLDKNQGIENNGKILVVGDDGNVTIGEVQGGDGIPIINTMSGSSPLVILDSAERINKDLKLFGKTEQVTTTGKNLLSNNPKGWNVGKGVSWSSNKGDPINTVNTLESSFIYLNVKSNTKYSFINLKKSKIWVTRIIERNAEEAGLVNHALYKDESMNKEKYTFTTTTETKSIIFQIKNVNTNNAMTETDIKHNEIMFYEGENVQYEPYTGGKPSPSPECPQEIKSVGKWNEAKQKYEVNIRITNAKESWDKEQTLTLTSERPITKWDKLVEQDGQIGWLYKSQIIDRLDGKSNKVSLGEKKGEVQHFSIEFKNTPKGNGNTDIYVDKYRAVQSSYALEEFGICCNWNDGIKYFSAPNINITNTEEFKAWLSENPLTLEYETETPEFVPLPQSEQDAIRALKTYYPTTVITTDGGEVNPDIEVSYIADTKNYIDQKIASVVKTVVETQKALL